MTSEMQAGKLVLGRYRIVRRLAQGGMGVVYLARIEGAEGFARPAVIKRMLPEFSEQDEHVRMFVREARILADLRHPGIVSVLDFAAESDAYLMALDYVDGFSLNQWLRYFRRVGRAFEPELAISMMARVLDALHYVHTRTDENGKPLGIVHRDISPSNILVDREGGVRILDFGVARTAREVTHSREGEVSIKGKLAYLAPELLQGDAPSPSTDMYACGVTLHELITGTNEFRDKDPTETMRRVLLNQLTELEPILPDVPSGFDSVIKVATAQVPQNRFQNAAEMADALNALLSASPREIEARLGERAKTDFVAVPATLKIPTLDDLERAWREAPHPDEIQTDPPPRVDVSVDEPAPQRSSGAVKLAIAGLAIVAVAGLGLGGYAVWSSNRASQGPQLVVVDQRSLDDPEPPAVEEVPDAGAAVVAEPPPEDEPPSAPSGRRGSVDPMAALTQRFNRRSPQLRRCFTEHTTESAGRPQLSVRFAVDRTGRVSSAQLEPAAVSGTPLGQCLLQVARGTTFGPQSGTIRFRIPITVTGG